MCSDFDMPEFFDPFQDYVPDFSEHYFDFESDQIIDGNSGFPYDDPDVQNACKSLVASGTDPNPTLRQLLEAHFEKNRPPVSDATDLMPAKIYERRGDSIYFPDAAFCGPTLRSEQSVSKTRDLEGFLVLPARYCTAIRSRRSNHDTPTPVLYLKSVDSEISALFE